MLDSSGVEITRCSINVLMQKAFVNSQFIRREVKEGVKRCTNNCEFAMLFFKSQFYLILIILNRIKRFQ